LARLARMMARSESDFKRKQQDVISEQSLTDKVSRVMFKTLSQEQISIEHIASDLALSKRSLQRKLTAEKQSFQRCYNKLEWILHSTICCKLSDQ